MNVSRRSQFDGTHENVPNIRCGLRRRVDIFSRSMYSTISHSEDDLICHLIAGILAEEDRYKRSTMQRVRVLIKCCILVSIAARSSGSVCRRSRAFANPFLGLLALSTNKPRLSPCAEWAAVGTDVAQTDSMDVYVYDAFISNSDTLYVLDRAKNQIFSWYQLTGAQHQTRTYNHTDPFSFFVTTTNEIVVDRGLDSCVSRYSPVSNQSTIVTYINRGCQRLFVTTSGMLYCLVKDGHLVAKTSSSNSTSWTLAAGTGCEGSTANMLSQPMGMYVDTDSTLYVADTGNDRVQMYRPSNVSGVTVADSSASSLVKPTSVVLDADKQLYIVDSGNQRIIVVGPNGYRCLIGCSTSPCQSHNRVCHPLSAMFDTVGNIIVVNENATKIVKFALEKNSCRKFGLTDRVYSFDNVDFSQIAS